jgi:ADP-heptose:LPS heptosyltransferase
MTNPQRMLVIGPSNIGDAILASPVIAALHRRYPEGHLSLAVGTRARALFAGDPRVHSLIDADAYGTPAGRLKLAWALWRYQPQAVVDLRHTVYPLLLRPLAAWRYLRQPPRTLIHMRERHLWKLRVQVPGVANGSRADHACPLAWTPRESAHVDQLWKRWNLDEALPAVLICPGARSHIKRWTIEGFAQAADRLMAEAGVSVIFSGEPDEEPVIEAIRALMRGRAHSAVGLTTVRQLGLLMQRVRLVITNDSASLHLASAGGIPTVAVFGPTDEAKYGPTAPRSRTIRRRLFCAPCEQALCAFNHECMRFIEADEVFAAAKELLRTAS